MLELNSNACSGYCNDLGMGEGRSTSRVGVKSVEPGRTTSGEGADPKHIRR